MRCPRHLVGLLVVVPLVGAAIACSPEPLSPPADIISGVWHKTEAALEIVADYPPPADIISGVWHGADDQYDYYFEIREREGALGCTVQTIKDGRNAFDAQCSGARYTAEGLELTFADTGVRYTGKLAPPAKLIHGTFHYRHGGRDMDLRWFDPTQVPGYLARPDLATPEDYSWAPPAPADDGWRVCNADASPLPREALEATVREVIAGKAGKIHSLLVVKGDELIVEEYFHGWLRDDLHRLASVTKSLTSLLIGIARDRGLIADLDAPIAGYYPQYADLMKGEWRHVTIRHLLTMSAGLHWSRAELRSLYGVGDEFFRRVLSQRFRTSPGEGFQYASADVSLLAGVLTQETGTDIASFAEEALFGPLEIAGYDWDEGFTDGFHRLDGTLELRPRDMAKLGALVLHEGRWRDRQVVSSEWVKESTSQHILTGDPVLGGYGYLWWLATTPESTSARVILGNGWGSQLVCVFPDLDLMVVTTGGNEFNGKHLEMGAVITRDLLPAVVGVR
jgi:CubicO group peptidase (beta-lactamase class C family)